MRLLYFLEPEEELGKPLFRMGTVRNHLHAELRSVRAGRAPVDVRMICSEAVAAESRAGGWLPGVPLTTVSPAELRTLYPDYRAASRDWYNGTYARSTLERAMDLYAAKLSGYEPDAILCYESNAPFLAELFPRALFLHSTLGMFSRAPYPETSCLDPFGVGKDAFLRRFRRELSALHIDGEAEARTLGLKDRYRRALLDHSPVRREAVRQGWQHVVLLPLQVSNYFMFDDNLPDGVSFGSQLDLVRYVLERIDPSIAVFVTMHGAEAQLMTPSVLAELKQKHPNFLHSEPIQRVRWASQHVLPHVDGVITVSSSVGLQAMLWDLPVVSLGRSHIEGIADGTTVEELSTLVRSAARPAKSPQLHFLLTRVYPLLERYHHDPEWFRRFLERSIEKKRDGLLDFSFFDPIDEEERLFEALVEDLRVGQMVEEVRKTGAHLRSRAAFPIADAMPRMAEVDVVCFDVFDTLITRPLSHPSAVLQLVDAEAVEALGPTLAESLRRAGGYPYVRARGADRAMREAEDAGRQEISMPAIAAHMAASGDLEIEQCRSLLQLELDIERRVCRPRELGVRLFEAAKRLNKRTVLISDVYLDRSFVEELLASAGITGYDALYVSSEHGVLKKTGDLFDKVRAEQGRSARYMHIGDNLVSDVHAAEKKGFEPFHLQNPTEKYLAASNAPPGFQSATRSRLGSMIHHGVISRKYADDPSPDGSCFSGSPYRLGYEAGGPIFLAFVQWIVQSAKTDGLERLYFLARDGHVIKQVYDLAREGRSDLPTSHYLLASRRAFSTAALRTPHDIVDSLEMKFSSVSIRDFIWHRYGLGEHALQPGTWERAGFRSLDEQVDARRRADVQRLRELLTMNADAILARAAGGGGAQLP